MSKLTSAQAYALQIKSDRRAAALERQNNVIREDNARIGIVLNKGNVAVKVAKAPLQIIASLLDNLQSIIDIA